MILALGMGPRSVHRLRNLGTALLASMAITACGNGNESAGTVSLIDGVIFGTFYQVTLRGERAEAELERLQAGMRERLNAIDDAMSTYRSDSELNRLNDTPVGEWLELSAELYEVLATSREISRQTDGAFDITVGGLVALWGFGAEGRPRRIPPPELIQAHRTAVGYTLLELDEERRTARRLADFYVDVSAIAKGHAIDAVGEYLHRQGERHFLINIGGDLLARGRRGDGRPWRIGIERPAAGAEAAHHVIPLEDMASATSGDYRNYFEHEGRRYSHLIDPRTGYPIRHRLASATVFHEANTIANAYATAMMVLGADDSLALARELELKALLITREGDRFRTRISPALREYLDDDLVAEILTYNAGQ